MGLAAGAQSLNLKDGTPSRLVCRGLELPLRSLEHWRSGGFQHVPLGPRNSKRTGIPTRLHWTGLGLQANSVEECVLWSILVHFLVVLWRTRDVPLEIVFDLHPPGVCVGFPSLFSGLFFGTFFGSSKTSSYFFNRKNYCQLLPNRTLMLLVGDRGFAVCCQGCRPLLPPFSRCCG